jgi:hypothetical protein
LTTKTFNSEAMKKHLEEPVESFKQMSERDLEDNLFQFEFKDVVDKEIVLANSPWSFDKKLVVLKEFRGDSQPSQVNLAPF